ncbi:MAG: branched-chain amino acid ABC transporter permease [Xanthobacteraceae bacterium]|nr:branched-chain amino acid ABC transporter permease [Xanthobacteraceae bacterium]
MSKDHIDAVLLLALAVLALLVPYIWSGYEIKLATTITIQAGLAVALGFVVGPAGLVSIGHAAFFGLAAYLFAMLAPASEPADLVTTLLAAVCGTAAFAAVVGAISIRSRGLYFILMTLAFGQLGYHFFHDTGIGGSADGTYIYFRPELRLPGVDINLDGAAQFYHFVSLIVFAAIALVWWLRRSAFGSLLVAARDNEMRVRAFGYSPYALRLVAFVISGAIAGAMGYLSAAQHGFVAPEMLAWHNSATALVMVLIGGKDTTSGPAIGAILLLLAEELLQRATEHWLVGIGLIIVVIVIAAPQGIVPYLAQLLRARRPQHA